MTDRQLNPDVERHLSVLAAKIGQEAADSFKYCWKGFLELDKYSESPIEQMMSIGLLYAFESEKHYCRFGGFSHPDLKTRAESREGFYVRPQVRVGNYRADFLITYRHYNGVVIGAVLECDGHDFHEKTKEQAQADKERDRYFQSLGFLVLRYTGAEIFKDPVKCALDALEILTTRAEATVTDDK